MSKIIILLLGFSLQIQASSYSQVAKFTLKLENVTVKKVFNEIEKSSEFRFVYKKSDVSALGKVSLDVKSLRVEEILDKCFLNSNISYTVMDKHIVIKKFSKVKDEKKDGYITGKVIGEKCNPMPGVTVVVQGTKIGVSTDAKGKYKIKAKKGDALKFTFIGYKTQLILIKDQKKIDVKMQPEREVLEETTVVAFGEQKKESVVSAITTVKSEALRSSDSDLTSSFAGKIAGLIGWQTGGAPGALTEEEMNTKFYIRGITSYQTNANIDPLILLDGIEVSKLDLARVDPDDIDSFSVLKDAAATAMYGARGANGVIYVKTKKGKEGSVRTTFRYEKIWSQPTDKIDVIGPKDYMKLYNETLLSRGISSTPIYTKEKIDNTNDPRFPDWVHPGVDWYKKLFKDYSINNHYSLNARGGGQKIQYYVSVNYNDDNGMIKTDQLNQFDCNITNEQTNFRTNININLNKTAKLTLNSFSTYDKYHGSLADVRQAYALAFNANSVDFAPVYPADEEYNWPHIRFGGSSGSLNPYAEIHKGYQDRIRYSTINKFEYIQNLNKAIKGLEFRFAVSLMKTGYFVNTYSYEPHFYKLYKYDYTNGKHTLVAINPTKADDKLKKDEKNSPKNSETTIDYKMTFLHKAAWGNHQTSFTQVIDFRQMDNSNPYTLSESLPHRNMNLASRFTYGYKDRYFVEASCGVNGSERFAKNNRIGLFPAIGGAWILTKEDFMRSTSNWLNFAKFRFSYGITGNDGVISTPRFLYLQDVQRSKGAIPYGEPKASNFYYNVVNYGNSDTEWEIAEQSNIGLDLKLLKGLIDINMDIYQEIRKNIYDYRRTLPVSMGLITPPLDNVGDVRSRGFDFSGKIQKAFSSDFWVLLNSTFTYNKAVFKKIEEPVGKKIWQKKVGHDISQQYCYIDDGLFQDQEEINNLPYQAGNIQPGDIKYLDIDKNGIIDINDAVMTGDPITPRIIYGFNGFLHYKNFEFSFAFQGSGQRSFFIDPSSISPFYGNKACLTAIAKDHWTEENHAARPFWPKLSTYNITEHNPQEGNIPGSTEMRKSTYFMKDGQFIRCKSLELSYYLNKSLLERFHIKNCKLYTRANNPFIISSFNLWDIELGSNGFNYPIQKTYSIGVNLSF